MGCIKRERQVLKLVHPGRHVEVLKEPITAAEVMRRNPRHCIARPDVFEFPSVVVKPESILLPKWFISAEGCVDQCIVMF